MLSYTIQGNSFLICVFMLSLQFTLYTLQFLIILPACSYFLLFNHLPIIFLDKISIITKKKKLLLAQSFNINAHPNQMLLFIVFLFSLKMKDNVPSINDTSQSSIQIQRTVISERIGQSQEKTVHRSHLIGNKKFIIFIGISLIVLILILGLTHVLSIDPQSQSQKENAEKLKASQIIMSNNQLHKNQNDAIIYNKQKTEKQQQLSIINQKQFSGQKIKFKIKQKTKNNTPQIHDKDDLYEFKLSIEQLVKRNLKDVANIKSFGRFGVTESQFQRAIRLLQVVHNVNSKGQLVLDHFNNYPSPQAKAQTLSKLLQEQKKYYEEKYEISKYAHDQIGICLYVPSYNNVKKRLYLRNLDSIFQQQYQNYHIVYVNDASTDGTGDYVKAYMEENKIPQEKYFIINNEKNKGSCANMHNVGHNYCRQGQIMVLLDGDDSLIGRQVFSLLNAIYQKQKVAMAYGEYLFVRKNELLYGRASKVIPKANLEKGTVRSLKKFFASHLKTMYVDVFRQIDLSNFKYDNGTFFQVAMDVAIMTTAIELVGTRLKFLHEFIYEYRFDTGQNDGFENQLRVSQIIYAKKPQKKLENMQFADNPKTVHYEKI